MKSPMITNADYIPEEEKVNYSHLKVMKSAAGYYIGTEHRSVEDDYTFTEPGSRDSEYFATAAEAQDALNNKSWTQRWTP
jgi:hypothetical protein